jgi:Na+/proline symporter
VAFSIVLLLINVFVMPIALGGLTFFPEGSVNSDAFVLAFPMAFDKNWLAIIVYLGGFSAATSMIIVSTIALSTMTSNSLLMPILLYSEDFQKRIQHRLALILLWARRITIFVIILMAYFYYKLFSGDFSLVSIGLISFVAIAQFTPAIIGGIFWKKGSRNGALVGMLMGFAIWFFTLVVPTMIETGFLPKSWLTEGLGGIHAFRPQALLGYEKMSSITHGLFFSLFTNLFFYIGISLFEKQSSKEHNQAIVFVDIFKLSQNVDNSIIWKGQAYLPDLKALLNNFLGHAQTQQMLLDYSMDTGKDIRDDKIADSEFINFSERVLSGIIGSASARTDDGICSQRRGNQNRRGLRYCQRIKRA